MDLSNEAGGFHGAFVTPASLHAQYTRLGGKDREEAERRPTVRQRCRDNKRIATSFLACSAHQTRSGFAAPKQAARIMFSRLSCLVLSCLSRPPQQASCTEQASDYVQQTMRVVRGPRFMTWPLLHAFVSSPCSQRFLCARPTGLNKLAKYTQALTRLHCTPPIGNVRAKLRSGLRLRAPTREYKRRKTTLKAWSTRPSPELYFYEPRPHINLIKPTRSSVSLT